MSKKQKPAQKKKQLPEDQTEPWAADEFLAAIKSMDPWGDWEWTLYLVGTAGIGLIAGVLTSFLLFSATPQQLRSG
jgi:hypothetical protein